MRTNHRRGRHAARHAHQGNRNYTGAPWLYRRVHVMLKREGWKDSQKRVYRPYRAEALSLRHKRPKRNKSSRLRQPKILATAINEIWRMDFMADACSMAGA